MRFFICVLLFSTVLFADAIESTGKIDSVVLYRGHALVTRNISFSVEDGAHELVVTNLPSGIDSDSLFANAPDNISIRAVQYRSRVVGESPLKDVKELDEKIEDLEKNIRENENEQKILEDHLKNIQGMRDFVVPSAKIEMSKGVLNPKSFTQMMDYIYKESKSINKSLFSLKEEARYIGKQLQLVREERRQFSQGTSKNVLEAVVFFEKTNAKRNSNIYLNYAVNNSTWSPFYNVRAKEMNDNVDLEYGALVQQTSGESWDNVSLTLSTASTGISAEVPELAPMLITLQRGSNSQNTDVFVEQYESLRRQQEQTMQSRGRNNRDSQMRTDWNLNKFSNDIQGLEYNSNVQETVNKSAKTGLTVNYQIPGRVTIASRSDKQMVEIRRLKLHTKFVNVATPLLSEYVYRRGKLKNSEEIALLEGKANVYLDGQFVGTSNIPMTAKGQEFSVGFGIDSQLRTSRELLSKSEVIQGGNKVMIMNYRLVLDNYKNRLEKVTILDRVPENSQNLRVTVTTKEKLSSDPEYVRNSKPEGILRWEVEVPAHTTAENSYAIDYTCQLEFDKGMTITTDVPSQKEDKYRKRYLK